MKAKTRTRVKHSKTGLVREKLKVFPASKELERIIDFNEDEPFEVLGPHYFKAEKCFVVNAFLPRAVEAWILPNLNESPRKAMQKLHPSGFFQAVFENEIKAFPYKLGFRDATGYVHEGD